MALKRFAVRRATNAQSMNDRRSRWKEQYVHRELLPLCGARQMCAHGRPGAAGLPGPSGYLVGEHLPILGARFRPDRQPCCRASSWYLAAPGMALADSGLGVANRPPVSRLNCSPGGRLRLHRAPPAVRSVRPGPGLTVVHCLQRHAARSHAIRPAHCRRSHCKASHGPIERSSI